MRHCVNLMGETNRRDAAYFFHVPLEVQYGRVTIMAVRLFEIPNDTSCDAPPVVYTSRIWQIVVAAPCQPRSPAGCNRLIAARGGGGDGVGPGAWRMAPPSSTSRPFHGGWDLTQGPKFFNSDAPRESWRVLQDGKTLSVDFCPTKRVSRGGRPRSGAYIVFTRKRAIMVKSSVKSLRTRLDGSKKGGFAHNNLRSERACRPVSQIYTIRTVTKR